MAAGVFKQAVGDRPVNELGVGLKEIGGPPRISIGFEELQDGLRDVLDPLFGNGFNEFSFKDRQARNGEFPGIKPRATAQDAFPWALASWRLARRGHFEQEVPRAAAADARDRHLDEGWPV